MPNSLCMKEGCKQRCSQQRTVSEIDDVEHAIDQRQTKRDECINSARQQAVDDRREKNA